MFRLTFMRCAGKKKVFELFCREELLVNYALRELSPAERRVTMSKTFKELPEEKLRDLRQRAAIEESRLEALQRAAAKFRPLTPYEFFVKEQHNNPALGTSANPRDREVKLLQIYETLPEKAREALAARAERYNTEHSKVPTAPGLPVIAVMKKKEVPTNSAKSGKKKKASKKKKKKMRKAAAEVATGEKGNEEEEDSKKKKKKSMRRGVVSPYSIFVKEQMASLHHLAPKERMRVIGERWRSLTNEERERRLDAARSKIASDLAAAAKTDTGGAVPAAKPESSAASSSLSSAAAPTPSASTPNTPVQRSETTATEASPSSSSPSTTASAAPIEKKTEATSPTPTPTAPPPPGSTSPFTPPA